MPALAISEPHCCFVFFLGPISVSFVVVP